MIFYDVMTLLLQELQNKSTWDLIQLYHHSENQFCQAQVLQVLLNREGLYYRFEDHTVEDRLENLCRRAAGNQTW